MSKNWENAFLSDSGSDEDNQVIEKDYYSILGVSPDSSVQEMKKLYRQKAKKLHPDKHPENEREKYNILFQELHEAYSILSNPDKKKLYDNHGMAGLKDVDFLVPKTQQDLKRLFNMLFDDEESDENDESANSTKPQCAPIVQNVTLPPLKTNEKCWKKQLEIERTVICTDCKMLDKNRHKPCVCGGRGDWATTSGFPTLTVKKDLPCEVCECKGYVIVKQRYEPCVRCDGNGKIVTRKFKLHSKRIKCNFCYGRGWFCKTCKNKQTKLDMLSLNFSVPGNTKNNGKRTFYGKGNQKVGYKNGDVIVVFKHLEQTDQNVTEKKKDCDSAPDCKQM